MDLEDEEFRRIGRRVVDLAAEVLRLQEQDPVLPQVTGDDVRAAFDGPLPRAGRPADEVLDELAVHLRATDRRNGHPCFFGYVCASVDPIGALADLLISASNQNVTAWRSAPGAVELELLVLRWLDELVGFGSGGRGLLVSGGSTANLVGLASALARGDAPRERQVLYRSSETHFSLAKAARLLGLRREHVRTIGVDGERRLRPDELERALQADRAAGLVPACVAASAGTANTGAVDPLEAIADVCARAGVWLHVDGAYGAPAAALPEHAAMRQGLGRADSLSLDPHKWLFAPIGVGCALVRDESAARAAFAEDAEYVRVHATGEIEGFAFFDVGPELSRRARALAVWAILQVRGADAIVDVVRRNVALREHLDRRVGEHPHLEPLGSGLSIACFRHAPPGLDAAALDGHNARLLDVLVRSGRFLLSPTELDGRTALRVCIVNFRTTRGDVDLLVDEVLRLGEELARQRRSS